MDYTQEMFDEDYRISSLVFDKYFSFFKSSKEDFVLFAVFYLSRAREKYIKDKANYFTFAFKVAYNAMCLNIRYEKKGGRDFSDFSLDFELNEDGDTLADTIGDFPDFDSNMSYEYLLDVCKQVIERQRSNNLKKFARLFILGYKPIEIAKIYKVSRQCVCQCLDKFKSLVTEKLKKQDFV